MSSHLTLVSNDRAAASATPTGADTLRLQLDDTTRQLELASSQLARKQRECDELVETLTHQAHRDALTGLFNRRKFDALCETEITRAARYGTPLALMMIDIDHFKNINDRYGHLVGDETLIRITQALDGQVRASDALCRWGGEEFMILAPQVDLDQAVKMAEKLCTTLAGTDFDPAGRITCSIGVVAMRENDRVADLVLRADTCLYRAKRNGRNRVEAQNDEAGMWF